MEWVDFQHRLVVPIRVFEESDVNRTCSGLPSINDGNIVLVAKLREQVESLKKQLSKKDQQLLDKDKQVGAACPSFILASRCIRNEKKS